MTATLSQKITNLTRDPRLQGEIAKLIAAEVTRQLAHHLAIIAAEYDTAATAAPVVQAFSGDRPGLLPIKNCGGLIGRSQRTIERAMQAGELKTVRPGFGRVRFVERSVLIAWAAKKFPVSVVSEAVGSASSPEQPTRATLSP